MADEIEREANSTLAHDGPPIVSEDSFFRRMPATLDAEQRLRFEALLYVADSLDWAFSTIQQIALHCAQYDGQLSTAQRTAMFVAAWSIVDDLDAARQVISKICPAPHGPNTAQLLSDLQPVRELRNDMDHLNQNIHSLAAAKRRRAPVFGALSFFYVPPEKLSENVVAGGQAFTICASAVGPREMLPMQVPSGQASFTVPVGLFKFSAFHVELDLALLITRFQRFMGHLGPSLEEDMRAKLAKHSEESGIPLDALLAPVPAGFVLAADIEFNDGGAN